MRWEDSGIILSYRSFGESSLIVSILTQQQGRYNGIIKPSKRLGTGALQAGNLVNAHWSARLSEHLGHWTLETMHVPCALLLTKPLELAALSSATALTHQLLAERHPYPEVYTSLKNLVQHLETCVEWYKDYILFELDLLEQGGYGLDLSACAATGSQDDLIYVSPKTGRAVSKNAGAPYDHLMLKLPPFLIEKDKAPSLEDILLGLKLTGYFLSRHLLEAQGLPQARTMLVSLLEQKRSS